MKFTATDRLVFCFIAVVAFLCFCYAPMTALHLFGRCVHYLIVPFFVFLGYTIGSLLGLLVTLELISVFIFWIKNGTLADYESMF